MNSDYVDELAGRISVRISPADDRFGEMLSRGTISRDFRSVELIDAFFSTSPINGRKIHRRLRFERTQPNVGSESL